MKPNRRFPTIERLEDRIAPATFLVTNLLDDASPGTLRKALIDANDTPGLDTITFKAGLTGTITTDPGRGAFLIDDPVVIKGPGAAKLTIDGGQHDRVFSIPGADNATTISGLRITGGKNISEGSGIYSASPLTLSKVIVIGNGTVDAGNGAGLWVHTTGDILIKDSEISGNGSADTLSGGGADLATTAGRIQIIGTKVVANTAASGAGLAVTLGDAATTLLVERSTITGNHAAAGSGGGLQVTSGGGTVLIKSTAFSGNRAVGTADSMGGALHQTGGSLTVQASLFHGNISVTGGGIAFTDGGRAMIQKSTFSANDSTLKEVANHGGGAIRFERLDGWTVTGSKFTENAAEGYGGAIQAKLATGLVLNSSFVGNEGRNGGAISTAETSLTVSGSRFTGNSSSYLGGGIFSFDVGPGLTFLTVEKSRFFGNEASGGSGGAINTNSSIGNVVVKDCIFEHNRSIGYAGGALDVIGGRNCTITGSTFRENQGGGEENGRGGEGGAIRVDSVEVALLIKDCLIVGNTSRTLGGGLALFAYSGNHVIENVVFRDNHAMTSDGGGLYILATAGVSTTISSSKFIGNSTAGDRGGGGIAITAGSTVILTKNVITGNFSGNGGGVFSFGTVTATGNTITGNSAVINPDIFGF